MFLRYLRFFLKYRVLVLSLFVVSLFATAVYASGGPFTPHQTLDPDCLPTTNTCYVTSPASGVALGDLVGGGTPQQVLYTDNSGNVFSDSTFTRDSVTKFTQIGGGGNGDSFLTLSGTTGLSEIGDSLNNGHATLFRVDDLGQNILAQTDKNFDVKDTAGNLLFGIDATNVITNIGTGLQFNITPVSGTHTIGLGEYNLDVDTTGGVANIQLPAANNLGVKGGETFKITDALGNAATNNITITPNGSDTINGQASLTINTNHGYVELHSDGTNNWIVTSMSSTTSWSLSGNSGTDSTTNFIGTTDAQPLVIKSDNSEIARFGNGVLDVTGSFQSSTITNCPSFLVTDMNGTIECGNGALSVNEFTVFSANAPGDNFHFTLPNGGTAPEIDFNINGSRRAVIGYDDHISGTGRTTYYNDASGTGIYLYNTGGIAFGNNQAAYAPNAFFVEPTSSQVRTHTGIKLGVGVAPTHMLDVSDTTASGVVASFTNSVGTCTLNPTNVSGLSCPSDENLKKEITTLPNGVLDGVLALRPVTYRFKVQDDSQPLSTGLIAQEVQTIFPDLVGVQTDGTLSLNYGGLTPYLVKAVQELNVKVTSVIDLTNKNNSFVNELISWLGNSANGITKLFAGEVNSTTVKSHNICAVDDSGQETCITKAQLDQILQGQSSSVPVVAPTPTPIPLSNPTPTTNPTSGSVDTVVTPPTPPTPDPTLVTPTASTTPTTDSSTSTTATVTDTPVVTTGATNIQTIGN